MVLGGLLLGKKGGLLAGLVGVGAKVLLQKQNPKASPTQVDASPVQPSSPVEMEALVSLENVVESISDASAKSLEPPSVLESTEIPAVHLTEEPPTQEADIPLPETPTPAPALDSQEAIPEIIPSSLVDDITHEPQPALEAPLPIISEPEFLTQVEASDASVVVSESIPPAPEITVDPQPEHTTPLLFETEPISVPTIPAVDESHEGDLTISPLDESTPPEPQSPEVTQPHHTEVELPAAVVEAIALVDLELANEDSAEPEVEMVNALTESTLPAGASLVETIPPGSTDIALEQALSQSEEFRNYGQPAVPVVEAPEPVDALADLQDHLKSELPWTNPLLDAPTSKTDTPVEPLAEENATAAAFVNWPGSEDEKSPDEEARATAFQQFVATMFSELAEPEEEDAKPKESVEAAPQEMVSSLTEQTGPVAASHLSSFIPELAHSLEAPATEVPPVESEPPASLETTLLEPITALEEEKAHPASENEPLEEIPQLSPEDIWKLAAAESSDFLQTDPGKSATPAITPFPFAEIPVSQPSVQPPAIPTPSTTETLPSFASFAELISQASGPPISHSSPPEQSSPPGMDPFEELFGTSPEQAAKDFFPTVEPREKPIASEPSAPPISFPSKRAPLLSTEEEAELDRFAEATPTSKVSPFSLNLSPQTVAQIDSIEGPAPQAVRFAPRPPVQEPKPQLGKALLLLLFAILLAAGYAFREPLLEIWNKKFAPQKTGVSTPILPSAPQAAPSTPAKSPVPAAPPATEPAASFEKPIPAAEPPAEKPTPPPVEPEPTVKPDPVAPVVEPKTQPQPEPEPAIPTPTTTTEPPSLITPPVTEPMPPKVEIRPASLLPDLPATPDAAEAASTEIPAKPEEAAQQKGLAAVKSFLTATTIEGVSANILNSAKLAPKLTAYYGAKAIPPTEFDNIVLDSGARVPETNSRAFLFRIRSPDRTQGFPVCVEETPQGYRIEWEAFIQCRDRVAANFWKDASLPQTSLFVIVKRSHYFDEDLVNLDDYECFRINSPNPDEEEFYAFARKDSAFVKKNRMLLNWDANYFVVAQFTHVKNSKGVSHVEIVDIDRFNWRGQTR